MHETARDALTAMLVGAASGTGGWGYYPGKAPRLEPTCWALLALADSGSSSVTGASLAPHVAFLEQAQRPDGLLVDAPAMPPNLASNGLAACVLPHVAPGTTTTLARLLRAITAVKGIRAPNAPDAPQDNTLQAWPWLPDTFSWVEPTAWCTLALKKAPPGLAIEHKAARVGQAEALLLDRQCAAGGWNYGNASALGQDLRPYVPTTALGLLALQDRVADTAAARALEHLNQARLTEPSAMALSLAALALRVHGRPSADVEQRLADDLPRVLGSRNLHHAAMMLYALTADTHGARGVRV